MKLACPTPRLSSTLALSAMAMSASAVSAQSATLTNWDQADIDSFVSNMESNARATNFASWSEIIDIYGTPHTSSDSEASGNVFTIEVGSTIHKPDGSHEVTTEPIYLTRSGIRCDASGTPIGVKLIKIPLRQLQFSSPFIVP